MKRKREAPPLVAHTIKSDGIKFRIFEDKYSVTWPALGMENREVSHDEFGRLRTRARVEAARRRPTPDALLADELKRIRELALSVLVDGDEPITPATDRDRANQRIATEILDRIAVLGKPLPSMTTKIRWRVIYAIQLGELTADLNANIDWSKEFDVGNLVIEGGKNAARKLHGTDTDGTSQKYHKRYEQLSRQSPNLNRTELCKRVAEEFHVKPATIAKHVANPSETRRGRPRKNSVI